MNVLVVIPTYDEAGTVKTILDRVLSAVPTADVLVVDDGSPDGTGDLVAAVSAADSRVHLLRRATKDGLGGAYRAGFAWGEANGYDVLVEMDADLSHPPEALPAMLDALADADLVIGSRYVPGGATAGWPWYRQAISRSGNAYVQLALGLGIRDATAGFRVFRADTLRAIDVQSLGSNGYCFQVETAYRTRRAGLKVAECPITFTERVIGASKMSSRIVAEALLRVTWWALTEGRAPKARAGRRVAMAHDSGAVRSRSIIGAAAVLAVLGLAAVLFGPFGNAAGDAPAPTGAASAPAVAAPLPAEPAPRPSAAPAEAPAPVTATPPVRVDIPAIGVGADVGGLGVAADGTVEVPTDFDDAGWLDTSALPGQQGPAIVLGHVDSRSGPAVFARLDELVAGDEITLTGTDGAPVTYTVTGSGRYPKADFPTELVYGPQPGPVLRLITCGGVFDSSVRSYVDNVVVFAAQL